MSLNFFVRVNGESSILYSALVDYKAYYDESLQDKAYKGAMQIFICQLNGKTTQLTQGNHHYHGHPTYSPNDQNIAYLYAEKLGNQRTYKLRRMNSAGGNTQQIHSSVYRESSLLWK